jgi:hypothetical protein
MAQELSNQSLAIKAHVHAQVSPRGIYDGQSGNGIGFSLSPSVLPCQYHSTTVLSSLIYYLVWGWKKGPLAAQFHTDRLTPS